MLGVARPQQRHGGKPLGRGHLEQARVEHRQRLGDQEDVPARLCPVADDRRRVRVGIFAPQLAPVGREGERTVNVHAETGQLRQRQEAERAATKAGHSVVCGVQRRRARNPRRRPAEGVAQQLVDAVLSGADQPRFFPALRAAPHRQRQTELDG
eukprot:3569865-Prymnesium_polylepis.2